MKIILILKLKGVPIGYTGGCKSSGAAIFFSHDDEETVQIIDGAREDGVAVISRLKQMRPFTAATRSFQQ
ncbi:MAG: hypothetical protein GX147_03405 [Deltaproteobacteria bacterium]|nr:hypothetical protein [Deltaproteobacteria bacterium]